MTAPRYSAKTMLSDQRGMVLVMTLFILVFMSILGVVVINLSSTDILSAAYEKNSALAFAAAESGLTQARSEMRDFVASSPYNGQWPSLDSTVIDNLPYNSASYPTVDISGEELNFTYTVTDFGTTNDQVVLISSTGTFGSFRQKIEVVLLYDPPEQTGAQECYNSECTSVDEGSSAPVDFSSGAPNSEVTL